MRILIITRSSWDNANSIGNTISNIFENFNDCDISNIYYRETLPNNNVCKKYFSISDKDMLKCLFTFNIIKPGKSFNNNKYTFSDTEKFFNYFRNHQNYIIQFLRELLWCTNLWKNAKLDQFLYNTKPDIIFTPCFSSFFTHRILYYIMTKTKAKLVIFHADDYINYNKNLKFTERIYKKIRSFYSIKSSKEASLIYCISRQQQIEYQSILNRKCKLLYKGAKLQEPKHYKVSTNKIIKILYVGSLLYGRWKTLEKLIESIIKVNCEDYLYSLDIYSQYEPNSEIKKKLNCIGISSYKGFINNSELNNLILNYDIILHVESFDVKERMETRLSFSTKIVDCLSSGRCTFAIGWKNSASIKYLIENNAAIVATSNKMIEEHLILMGKNKNIISDYAVKGWECCKRNHDINNIQNMLYTDFNSIIHKDENITY